jgi:hypothetical protein
VAAAVCTITIVAVYCFSENQGCAPFTNPFHSGEQEGVGQVVLSKRLA